MSDSPISIEEGPETLEQTMARINKLWSKHADVQQNTDLVTLIDRQKNNLRPVGDPVALLHQYHYPERTNTNEISFTTWKEPLEQKFCRDGYIYLLRGDYPNKKEKGLYSYPYGYGQLTTNILTHQLRSSSEVGYFLYGDETYLRDSPRTEPTVADELASLQSSLGRSSFISATTNIATAEVGTGNQVIPDEQATYQIYILKVPTNAVLKRPHRYDHFGLDEKEYLVADYVLPSEIIAVFSRADHQGVYEFMRGQVGVDKSDLG